MSIKAIETKYNGYRFRSRLEARWAVFFDALGVRYEYELQGFEVRHKFDDCPKRWHYLPDFYLPQHGTWVEVKGSLEEVSEDYLEMIGWAVDWGGCLPGVENSVGSTRGLLWLGPLPSPRAVQFGTPVHAILQHEKGGWAALGYFAEPGGLQVNDRNQRYFDASWGDGGKELRAHLAATSYGVNPTSPEKLSDGLCLYRDCDPAVAAAYAAARSARFEHGETPRPR